MAGNGRAITVLYWLGLPFFLLVAGVMTLVKKLWTTVRAARHTDRERGNNDGTR